MMPLVIAIDGPAASGKGTIAKRVAMHYGLPWLDTGLLYRATARRLIVTGCGLDDVLAATEAAQQVTAKDLEDSALRTRQMSEAASKVAVIPEVRAALETFQRAFAAQPQGAVLDGRDIGTVICPHATVKLFVSASLEARSQRRTLELHQRGEPTSYEDVHAELEMRDRRDENRSVAPLQRAPNALLLDTSDLDIEGASIAAITLIVKVLSERATG